MTHSRFPLRAFVAAALLTATASFAVAQDQPAAPPAPSAIPVIVGIVDVQAVLEQSKAGQGVKAKLEAKRKAIQADIDKTEKQLKAEQDQLNVQRPTLPPEEFQKKTADFQAKVQKYRKDAEAKKQELDKSYNDSVKQMMATLQKVITDVATKSKLTLVLNRSTVILSAEAWDITDTVLKEFNKALPAVK